jgi:hypothetical protein
VTARSAPRRPAALAALLGVGFTVLASAALPGSVVPSVGTRADPPLVIRSGGSYTGAWRSDDPDVPAVTVATTEPVVITRSVLEGRGPLVATSVAGADVTVRDSKGRALYPGGQGRTPGRFVAAEDPARLVVANNDLQGTSGIYVLGWRGDAAATETITIVGNRARNIDGRKTGGPGGWSRTGFDLVQFVQLNKVAGVPGIEIAWNEVVNEPYASRVEDNISIHLSGGTPTSPLRIHDNYIQGGYPSRPSDDDYGGGGILLGDGRPGPGDRPSSWARAFDNQVVGTNNYGIAIAAGHDLAISGNRVVSSGRLLDGTPLAGQNVGVYVWNAYRLPDFANNVAAGNVVGWSQPAAGRRNDWWLPDCAGCAGNIALRGRSAITLPDEAVEWAAWRSKVAQAGVRVGAGW